MWETRLCKLPSSTTTETTPDTTSRDPTSEGHRGRVGTDSRGASRVGYFRGPIGTILRSHSDTSTLSFGLGRTRVNAHLRFVTHVCLHFYPCNVWPLSVSPVPSSPYSRLFDGWHTRHEGCTHCLEFGVVVRYIVDCLDVYMGLSFYFEL